jgi:hypothetical protein
MARAMRRAQEQRMKNRARLTMRLWSKCAGVILDPRAVGVNAPPQTTAHAALRGLLLLRRLYASSVSNQLEA